MLLRSYNLKNSVFESYAKAKCSILRYAVAERENIPRKRFQRATCEAARDLSQPVPRTANATSSTTLVRAGDELDSIPSMQQMSCGMLRAVSSSSANHIATY